MMGTSVDILLKFNSTCIDCLEPGPPPNSILNIPPPPLPLFLQRAFNNNADPCSIQCDWNTLTGPGIEYVELPRQVVTGPAMDDTWLLVLIACCSVILLFGVVVTLIFLKSRVQRSGKGNLQVDVPSLSKTKSGAKGCEAVLYPCTSTSNGAVTPDSRILWAALTPRGTTQHFITEPNHKTVNPYEVPHLIKPISLPQPLQAVQPVTGQLIDVPAFDNSGFVDSDDPMYSEPLTPLYSEPILLNEMMTESAASTLKRCSTLRPTVSSPTRIENNLPPLNMMHNHRSLRRATLSRKDSDLGSPVIL